MGQWGIEIISGKAKFLTHVNTGGNPFDPISDDSVIDSITMIDDGGDASAAQEALFILKKELVAKPYRFAFQKLMPIATGKPRPIGPAAHLSSKDGVRTPGPMTDLERARVIMESRDTLAMAEAAHREIIKLSYPVGAYVRWRERPYIKAGVVRGYSLTGYSLRVDETNGRQGKIVPMEAVVMAAMDD